MRRVILVLDTLGPTLRVERIIFKREDITHEAVVCFAKHAPCTIGVFDAKTEERIASVELKIVGSLV